MNIYLSLPISGRTTEEVEKEIEYRKEQLKKERPESNILSPFDVCKEPIAYSKCIGLDIMTLLECDAVCMCPGWEASRGCQLEYEAAKIYHKKLLFL